MLYKPVLLHCAGSLIVDRGHMYWPACYRLWSYAHTGWQPCVIVSPMWHLSCSHRLSCWFSCHGLHVYWPRLRMRRNRDLTCQRSRGVVDGAIVVNSYDAEVSGRQRDHIQQRKVGYYVCSIKGEFVYV